MKNMRRFKVTSLILVVAMLLGMIPMGMITAVATESGRKLTMPETLPDGSEYHSVIHYQGDNYEESSPSSTDAWLTADGVMITFDTYYGVPGSGNNFNCYLQVTAGFASTSSYLRFDTLPTQKDLNEFQTYDTISYCMSNGNSWDERKLGRGGSGGATSCAATTATTEAGYTFVYLPMDTFRFMGSGAADYTGYEENQDIAWMRNMIGMPITEFRYLFEEQSANLSFSGMRYSGKDLPIVRIDFVYKNEDHSRPADAVTKALELTASMSDETGYLTAEGGLNALLAGNRLIVANMPVNNETGAARIFMSDLIDASNSTDLSRAEGIQVDVDSSALGSASLHLKMNLQMRKGPNAVFPNNTTILNKYGDLPTGVTVGGKTVHAFYEDFSGFGDYIQFTNRAGAAVAYITGVDSEGNSYDSDPVYTTGATKTTTSGNLTHFAGPRYSGGGDGGFVLPAGFKGTVYIPMSSYYINVYGSYGSGMLLPFDQAPVQSIDAVGFYSTISGAPDANLVTYENISIVERTGDFEIDNEADFMAFAEELASGNDFAGKIVSLNADLTFNKGWNAFAADVKAPTVVYPDMSGVTFAGKFEGNGHTISGLYMTGTSFCGFFGNVASGKQVTVKDLDIVNSYIGAEGAQGVGGLFGQVEADVVTSPKSACYQTKTKAIIENVYLDINIVNNTSGVFDMGTGGFIGGTRSDVRITKSVFAGSVTSGTRGVSAFIGSTMPYTATYNDVANVPFYRIDVKYYDCAQLGALIGVDGEQNFLGAIVGYAGGITEDFFVSNFVSTGTIADAADSMAACDGYLIGGGWASSNKVRVTSRGDGSTATTNDYQRWSLRDVYYVETSGDKFGVVGNSFPAMMVSWCTTGSTATHYSNAAYANANPSKKTMEELPGTIFVRYGEFEQGLLINDGLAISLIADERDLIAPGNKATITIGVGTNAKSMTAMNEGGKYTFALIDDVLPKDICTNLEYSMIIGESRVEGTTSIETMLLDILSDDELSGVHALVSDYIRYAKASQNYWALTATPEELAMMTTIALPDTLVTGSSAADIEAPGLLSFSMTGHSYGWNPQIVLDGKLALEIGVDESDERSYVAMIGNRIAKTERNGDKLVVYVYAHEISSEIVVMDDLGVSMTCSFADALVAALGDASGLVSEQEKTVLTALGAYCQSVMDYVNS